MAWTAWKKVAGFDFKEVIYEKKYHAKMGGGIARITMNRPNDMNNLSPIMSREKGIAFYDASEDLMIGAVVLTGAGDRAFCTGGDVRGERAAAEAGMDYGAHGKMLLGEEAEKLDEAPQRTSKTCRKPVIARVNGYAIGNGFHQALECDITIATEHAVFGHNGPRVSSPAPGGYISYITYVVGAKKAHEMNFLCSRYTAQEAFEMGLVNKVVRWEKLDEEVDKWCELILLASPVCIEARKRSFDVQLDYEKETGSAIMQMVAPGFIGSPEQLEGTAAFLEKRPTNFWKLRKELGEAAYNNKKA